MPTFPDTGSIRHAAETFAAQARQVTASGRAIPTAVPPNAWRGAGSPHVGTLLVHLHSELLNAGGALNEIADILRDLALSLDRAQDEYRAERAREEARSASFGAFMVASLAEVTFNQSVRAAIQVATDQLLAVRARATRSEAHRFRIATESTGYENVLGGFWDEVVGTYHGVRHLLSQSPATSAREFAELGAALRRDPAGTLRELFDLDTLRTQPDRWIGGLLPGVAASLLPGGGVASKVGRFGGGAKAEDLFTGKLRLRDFDGAPLSTNAVSHAMREHVAPNGIATETFIEMQLAKGIDNPSVFLSEAEGDAALNRFLQQNRLKIEDLLSRPPGVKINDRRIWGEVEMGHIIGIGRDGRTSSVAFVVVERSLTDPAVLTPVTVFVKIPKK